MPDGPRISVLLPLQDERATAEACVRAWTAGQSAAPESYEVIALAPGDHPNIERLVRPMLRAHDRWIARPGKDEYELFDLGAGEALGDYLFLTEAHCVPQEDCLSSMLAELDNGVPGVRGESVPEVSTELGRFELEMFDEAQKAEEDPEHWRKILIHSMTLRRDLFLEAGGTPSRYGDFCTWVLSIALHERGVQIPYSPVPRVSHTYDGDLHHIDDFVRSFRKGEVLYRSERPPEEIERYLERLPEWERRLSYTKDGGRRALRAALTLPGRGTPRSLRRHARASVLGARGWLALTRRRAKAAARRLRRAGNPEAKRTAFRELWAETGRVGTLEGIAEFDPPPPAELPALDRIELSESLAGQVIGFHPVETVDGVTFRWTEPLALIRVTVPGEGRMRARLELLEAHAPRGAGRARVAVDGRRVRAEAGNREIAFEVEPGERWIALACPPLLRRRHGSPDRRDLGIPLRALSFEPATSEGGR